MSERYKITPRANEPISWEAWDTTNGKTVARGMSKEEVEQKVKNIENGKGNITVVILSD